MKKLLLLSVTMIAFGHGQAQSLTPEVIGSAGDVYSSSSGSLEWTLGEIMTETYQQSNGFLTQGFHQTGQGFVGISELNIASNFIIYPNPVKDFLNFSFHSKQSGKYIVELFDMQGKKLLFGQITVDSGIQNNQLNMQNLSGGVYLLNVYGTDTFSRNVFRINKLN